MPDRARFWPCLRLLVPGLLVLGMLLIGLVRAAGVPIVVERYDATIRPDQVAALVRGDFNDSLRREDSATIAPAAQGTSWYRLRLSNDWLSPREAALVIADANRIVVHAYLPLDYAGTEYGNETTGTWRRLGRVMVIPLGHNLRATTPVYLRVDSSMLARHALTVTDLMQAQAAEVEQARFDIIWPAMQIALLLAALLTLRPLEDRLLIPFVAQTLGIALFLLMQGGFAYTYWPIRMLDPLDVRANGVIAAFVMVCALAFTRVFLDLRRRAPTMARAGRWTMFVLVAFALLCILPVPLSSQLLMRMLGLCVALAAVLVCSSGWLAWRRGQRGAGLFTAAWAPTFLVMLLNAAYLLLLEPRPSLLIATQPVVLTLATFGLMHVLAMRMARCRFDPECAPQMRERDVLTGSLTRSVILSRLRDAFIRARHGRQALSLIVLELDAQLRERAAPHGRGSVDACMHAVMGCLIEEMRDEDTSGRIGDERLLVLLPGSSLERARAVAARVAARMAASAVYVGGERMGVAASLGVAMLGDGDVAPDTLLARAEADRQVHAAA